MRVTQYGLAATVVGVSMLTPACDDSTGPNTGTIDITVSTTGVSIDLDPNGYTLSLDGEPGLAVGVNGSLRIGALAPGTHAIRLDGLAPNCSVSGTNPQSVDVTAGKSAAFLPVAFSVSCGPNIGSIQVTTATSGPDPDVDGYFVTVEGVQGVRRGDVTANGTSTIAGIREGAYTLALSGVSGNCTVAEPRTRVLNIMFGATAEVAFTVRCVPAGSLRVTTSTTGVDLDPDGYDVDVRLEGANSSTRVTVSASGSATVSGLLPGDYLLTLFGVVPNCDPVIASPRMVAVSAGEATPVTADVTCVAPTPIAFVSNGEIQLVNSNGSGRAQLTFTPRSDVNPAWSPDGIRIAFASERDGNFEIYVMNANGTNPARLTNFAAVDKSPAWSPDGTRIAFASTRDGQAEIYVMNADGTNPSRLTVHGADDSEPAWSPDGSRIAFSSDRDGIRRIWIMNADGSGVARFTSSTFGERMPAWSPDGTRIAFSGESSSGTTEIFIVNSDGSGRIQLTRDFDVAADPAWSPDGRKIAFTATKLCRFFYDYECFSSIQVVGTNGILYSAIFGEQTSEPAWRP